MGAIEFGDVPDGALVIVDSAPIIYVIESHPTLRARFEPIFAAHEAGRIRLGVATLTIVEVMTGPLLKSNEALARRYRAILESWTCIDLTPDIAETAARMRALHRLKLPDAIQAATVLAVNAAALVTHDRDFLHVPTLKVIL